MNQQTEERLGITSDRLHSIKCFRKILFVKMLCNPIFVLVYWCFCTTLYRFCMYGGVKKRGTVLVACMIFFLGYLICYCIRTRKVKTTENLPEKMDTVKWYGFLKNSFYLYDENNGFFAMKCDNEEKDYLQLKYAELPKYKHFFWRIPAYLILFAITVMTICGVIKSGTNFNGKLAWYLYKLRHTPVVSQQQKEEDTVKEDSIVVVWVDENLEETGEKQEEPTMEDSSVTEETIPVENPDEKRYGIVSAVEGYYEDANGKIVYSYSIYQYLFSDLRYQKVNETLQSVYDKVEEEFREYSKNEGGIIRVETAPDVSASQKDYIERVFTLADLTYVGEDYVSLIFKEMIDGLGIPRPMPEFVAVTIDIHTGEIADVEEITGCTWEELAGLWSVQLNSDNYVYCLYGDEVYFIEKFGYFQEETVVVPRARKNGYYPNIQDEVYKKLILELMETNTFPGSDGAECDGMPYDNTYSIMDIDDDGKEELVINYANALHMAGMVLYIYDYDHETKEIYIEYSGWPDMSVYDNGYIKENASHNHGRSNLSYFWPYSLLQYDENKDRYECIAYIDAWQYGLFEGDALEPEFPKDKDLDGDGVLYYDMNVNYYEPQNIMDKAEYDAWCEQYNKGNIKEITWQPIISKEKYYEMFPSQATG